MENKSMLPRVFGPKRFVAWIGLLLLIPIGCATVSPQSPGNGPANPAASAAPAPAPLPPMTLEPVAPSPPSGSLWTANSTSLYEDIKARKVGDIVIIAVSEQAQATKQASTQTGRSKDFSADLKFLGATSGGSTLVKDFATGYGGQLGSNFNGNGVTSKTDSMVASMTATVVAVLPNGNLVIRGSRWTKVNEEMQEMVLEGVVRPTDIDRKNQILSQNIADAKIFYIGKGPLTKQQKPGWLGQVFDAISPF